MKRGLCWLTVLGVLSIVSYAITATAAGPPSVGSDTEKLGMRLYKDKNMSLNKNQSCQTCHHPMAGFADRTNFLDPETKVVSLGSDGVSLGGRNAPTSAYAGFSPIRYQDADGEWIGGMFWDGRMDGLVLGDPLAEQAQGPPLNPVEMALEDADAVIQVIMESGYYNLWKRVFGEISDVGAAYDNFARAIAAYERSADVTKFSSKFDLAPEQFTTVEINGKALFEAKCAVCHPTTAAFNAPAALFTTYGYVNIGVPVNPLVPEGGPDLGLGGDLGETDQDGKFKIPTLRNVAVTAPYSHNGSFATLEQMVGFINDNGGFTPEVDRNITPSEVVGDLGLSAEELVTLVAFLHTLTDDF